MGFGMIGRMLILWIVLIGLAVLLVRGLFQSNQSRNSILTKEHPSARQILERRYARAKSTRSNFGFFSMPEQ